MDAICQVAPRWRVGLTNAEGSAGARVLRSFLWGLVLLGIMCGQGWKTLHQFGSENPLQRMTNDQPITSGRHALHLYHGYLGSHSLQERGTACCYDPSFQAGYPKTPVFDGGSRPAELFLTIAGGGYRPDAYKIGLALCVFMAPLLLWVAGRAAALCHCGAFLIAALAGLITWSTPGQRLLTEGDLSTFLAGLAVVLLLGMLLSFHRRPSMVNWLGVAGASCLGWFADPLLFLFLSPLLLVYLGSIGTRHSAPWYGALLAGFGCGIVANLSWLPNWFSNWWIRVPTALSTPWQLAHRTPRMIWETPLWGNENERLFALLLLTCAGIGVVLLNRARQRTAARLLGCAVVGIIALVVGGVTSETLGGFGTDRLLVPGLWCASLPAAYAVTSAWGALRRFAGNAWRAWLLTAAVLPAIIFVAWEPIGRILEGYAHTAPLRFGLDANQTAIVDTLSRKTTANGRILWEDLAGEQDRFSPLLPVLTQRFFLGGLDSACGIEHDYATLVDSRLAGRALATWSDDELASFCRTYNIGWVVCRNPASAARFTKWKDAVLVTESPASIYQLPPHSYALVGQVRIIDANPTGITLADVVPENGQVLLSLHYQSGLRASPSRVQVERATDADDPIPFVRLRLSNPVARLTLSWTPR